MRNLNILDVGCGTGITMNCMREYGTVYGIDNSAEAMEFCKRRKINKLVMVDANRLSFKTASFDLIYLLDVLEHIKNDKIVLKELGRLCKDQGRILIFVPAYKFLWGSEDVISHHVRRYNIFDLRKKVAEAGFKIDILSYVDTILFPAIFLSIMMRKLLKKDCSCGTNLIPLPSFLNRLLGYIFAIEAVFLPCFNFPYGASIVCLATKNI